MAEPEKITGIGVGYEGGAAEVADEERGDTPVQLTLEMPASATDESTAPNPIAQALGQLIDIE